MGMSAAVPDTRPEFPAPCFCGGMLMPCTTPDGAQAWRCGACGYLNTAEAGERSSRTAMHEGGHPSAYQGQAGRRFSLGIGTLRQWSANFRVRASRIAQTPARGRALDFGCGQGFYLNALRSAGFEAQGLELSELTARRAQAQGHAVARALADLPDARFDAVLSIHVLEHIPEVRTVLRQMRRVLKPGARFHFEVPNFASVQARIFGFRWLHCEAGLHAHHFTPPALTALLRDEGFRVERVGSYSFEHGLAGWLQSLYNLAFPYNRFFRCIILDRPLRDKLSALPELLLFPLVLALSAPLFLLESALGRGAVIRVEGRFEPTPAEYAGRESP